MTSPVASLTLRTVADSVIGAVHPSLFATVIMERALAAVILTTGGKTPMVTTKSQRRRQRPEAAHRVRMRGAGSRDARLVWCRKKGHQEA